MIKAIKAEVRRGYTGLDHLIESKDEEAANEAVAGLDFETAEEAAEAADEAYTASCDPRVRGARIQVTYRDEDGAELRYG